MTVRITPTDSRYGPVTLKEVTKVYCRYDRITQADRWEIEVLGQKLIHVMHLRAVEVDL